MTPMRRAVYDSVQRIRDGNEPHRHLNWARHTMRIPEADFHALMMLYPDLKNYNDPDAQRAAWDRFERSAFAERYRVGRLFKGVIKNGVIIP